MMVTERHSPGEILSWGRRGRRTINSLLSKHDLSLEHNLVLIIYGVCLLNLLCHNILESEGNSVMIHSCCLLQRRVISRPCQKDG